MWFSSTSRPTLSGADCPPRRDSFTGIETLGFRCIFGPGFLTPNAASTHRNNSRPARALSDRSDTDAEIAILMLRPYMPRPYILGVHRIETGA
jgi:hypothetical protein